MTAPIALQLYTLREAAAEGFDQIVRKVADIGYVGVETAGFPGTTPEAAAKLFTDLGLEVCSAHLPLPVGDKRQESLDTAATLGIARLVSGCGPDDFKSRDSIKATAERFNEAADACRQAGLSFGIHNHWWEFQEVDGARGYKHLLEDLSDDVFFNSTPTGCRQRARIPWLFSMNWVTELRSFMSKTGPAISTRTYRLSARG